MLGSVPEPHTWYRDIKCVPSGHYAWIENGQMADPVCWFDIGGVWRDAPAVLLADDVVREQIRAAVRESVSRHLVADVPVGVFLSGGVDSSVLAALMVELGVKNIQSVTIAYDEFAGTIEDEAPLAAAVAAHYGIRHTVRRVTRAEFLDDLPRIIEAMDQPTIDGINTWYASKAVAELGLKVVVSGVGGDELFQGYESFDQLPRLVAWWSALSRIPGMQAIGKLAGDLQARRTGNDRWRHAAQWACTISGAWWLRRSLYTPEALSRLMDKQSGSEALPKFDVSRFVQSLSGVLATDNKLALGQIESTTYLRNQLLRDSDWASMDHSVELRTPLVDAHLLASLRAMLPSLHLYPGKRLLAGAPEAPLPREIATRRKTGFGIPVEQWLADGPVGTFDLGSRGWARDLVVRYEAGN